MTEQERQKGKKGEKGEPRDPERAVPRSTREQDAPAPERPRRTAEEAGQAPHQVEDPPQAEGKRGTADD